MNTHKYIYIDSACDINGEKERWIQKYHGILDKIKLLLQIIEKPRAKVEFLELHINPFSS